MATATTAPAAQQLQTQLREPAGTPPAGVSSDFQNPSNLNTFLILTLTLVFTFGTLAVLIRMYTKLFIIRFVAYEDYAVVLGWLLQIAETVPSAITTRHGGGSHMWDIRHQTYFDMLYWTNLSSILYCPTVFFIKLSILLQYLRVFVPNRKANMSMFISIHICIWSCFIVYLAFAILGIVQCTPREKIWHPRMASGRCLKNTGAAYFSAALFNVVTDFAILILPMPSLWKLQMPLKKKILSTAVFATGFVACATSILRTYYAWQIFRSRDISYNVVQMGLWTYAEIAIGTIVSCTPALPKFFRHFLPRIIHAKFAASSKSGKPGGYPRPRPSSSSQQQPSPAVVLVAGKPRSSSLTESAKKLVSRGSERGQGEKGGVEEICWNDAYHPAFDVKGCDGCYLVPDGDDDDDNDDAVSSVLAPETAKGTATRREDLESGHDDSVFGGRASIPRRRFDC